ncbi:MAG TPA: hypothetical protein VFZ27_08560 [Terriglobia bacterium]|nr:hypothetical protein [Terriglobia bacterium]
MNTVQTEAAEHSDANLTDNPPNGPVGAAILSAAVGCCALALLAMLGDGSAAAARWLTFYVPTGPLSGVTTTAVVVWLISWSGLARRWRSRTVAIGKVNTLAFVLLGLSLLLTFPPLVDLLLGK